MKNIRLFAVILALLICGACSIGTLQAQSGTDEQAMRAFAREFMAAYNRQDVTALQAMYTSDAVSIVDSIAFNGADRIAQLYTDQFIRKDATLLVRQIGMTWSDAQQAIVATGTYEIFGATYVYDIPFQQTTAYRNTMVQENGQWKIARSMVTQPVKTIVYQKVGGLTEWNSSLTGALYGSGVLSVEVGKPHGDANTACALLEWPSMDTALAFFEKPDWQKNLQQADISKKPVVIFLDGNLVKQ